jgi:Spy/CpxP family protein refolding chaperone
MIEELCEMALKKILFIFAALMVLVTLTAVNLSYGQGFQDSYSRGPGGNDRGYDSRPQRPPHPNQIARELGLSSEQWDQYDRIMMIQKEKKRSFMENHRQETVQLLSDVLDSEQLQIFEDAMSQYGSGKGGNRRQSNSGGGSRYSGEGQRHQYTEPDRSYRFGD